MRSLGVFLDATSGHGSDHTTFSPAARNRSAEIPFAPTHGESVPLRVTQVSGACSQCFGLGLVRLGIQKNNTFSSHG